jgi:hypothetical protein
MEVKRSGEEGKGQKNKAESSRKGEERGNRGKREEKEKARRTNDSRSDRVIDNLSPFLDHLP